MEEYRREHSRHPREQSQRLLTQVCDSLSTSCRLVTRTPRSSQWGPYNPGRSLGGTSSEAPPTRKSLLRHTVHQHLCLAAYVCFQLGMLRLQPPGRNPPHGSSHILRPLHHVTCATRPKSTRPKHLDTTIAPIHRYRDTMHPSLHRSSRNIFGLDRADSSHFSKRDSRERQYVSYPTSTCFHELHNSYPILLHRPRAHLI